jgi:hypothetical protein
VPFCTVVLVWLGVCEGKVVHRVCPDKSWHCRIMFWNFPCTNLLVVDQNNNDQLDYNRELGTRVRSRIVPSLDAVMVAVPPAAA